MDRKPINEITIETVKKKTCTTFIDDDLLIFDNIAEIPFPDEPRRMNCLLLALCRNGKACYAVDTEEQTVQSNDIIIISQGQVVDNYMLSNDCNGIGFLVSYDFFNEIIKGIREVSSLFLFSRNYPVCTLRANEAETLVTYFNMIKERACDTNHHFRKETVQSLLTTMIYDVSNAIYRIQNIRDKKQTRAEAIFRNFIKLVEQNFRRERRVGWYALQLGITPKYLSETIKQISRRTPNEWIDNYVILEIRVQLKSSAKSIKEITHELNFPNQSFLGKYFKEHVGTSPTEYRKS